MISDWDGKQNLQRYTDYSWIHSWLIYLFVWLYNFVLAFFALALYLSMFWFDVTNGHFHGYFFIAPKGLSP